MPRSELLGCRAYAEDDAVLNIGLALRHPLQDLGFPAD
jgi:hypothetical protein